MCFYKRKETLFINTSSLVSKRGTKGGDNDEHIPETRSSQGCRTCGRILLEIRSKVSTWGEGRHMGTFSRS